MRRLFDVEAALAVAPLAGAEVVAGARGLSRQVTGVTTLTAAGAAAGDLVLVPASVVAESSAGMRLVGRLAGAGVAAVVLHGPHGGAHAAAGPSRDARPCPAPELVAAADRAGLPVLSLPPGTGDAEVRAAVLERLLDAQSAGLARREELDRRFGDVVAAGGGVGDLAAALYALVGRPVVVLDPSGRSVASVPSGTAVTGLPGAATEPKGAGRRETGRREAGRREAGRPPAGNGATRPGHRPGIARGQDVRRPVTAGGNHYGTVVVQATEEDLGEDGRLALARATTAIATSHAQARALSEAHERFAAVTLEELVSGHATDREAITERAGTFGWDLDRPRAVLLASIDPPFVGTNRGALAVMSTAARVTLGRDAIVWTRSATVAALVAPRSDDPGERRDVALALKRELDARLTDVTVSIGVGRRVRDPLDLPRSFAEAVRAVDVGRWVKGRHVTEVFDDLGLERILAASPTEELQAFVRHAIGELLDHDRDYGTDLVASLEAWLETRNVADTARRRHVHYNTMRKRLDRIEVLIGPVLNRPLQALECGVALHILRHHVGVSSGF